MALTSTSPSQHAIDDSVGDAGRARRQLADQTRDLFLAADTADPATRRTLHEQVVVSHLWLARSLAQRFRSRGENEDDLLQVASMGLIEATQRFNPDKGSFVGFAIPTIRGVLRRHFRDQTWAIRPSRQSQEALLQVRQLWPDLAQTLGAIPTDAELGALLGKTPETLRRARVAGNAYRTAPLDPAQPSAGVSRAGSVDDQTDQADTRLVVGSALSKLNAEEQQFVHRRYIEDRSQVEIAGLMGVSQMQVSRLQSRLLRKLRNLIGEINELRVRPAA